MRKANSKASLYKALTNLLQVNFDKLATLASDSFRYNAISSTRGQAWVGKANCKDMHMVIMVNTVCRLLLQVY